MGFWNGITKEQADALIKLNDAVKHPCIFCGDTETEFHLELWMCKRCEIKVAQGFDEA